MKFSDVRWPVHPAAEKFPMMIGTEFTALADDIAEHGLREPVWLWRDPDDGTVYLLDGRNRTAACAESGTEVRTRYYDGDDPISFVVSLNVNRRHLNEGQKAFIALELVPLYEEQGRREMARAAAEEQRKRSQEGCATWHNPEPKSAHRSTDKAASVVGTSGRSVARAKRLDEKAKSDSGAAELKNKVLTGEMELGRAERIIRDREAEQRRINHAKAEAATAHIQGTIDIRHGDFRDVLADLTGIDAIITDPPYPHEFIPLLGDLAALADKILTPDGIMAILIGQTYLPEVYRLLERGRPYRWTGCYLTPGQGYVSHPRKVQSNWKPLIVYGGGPRFSDVVSSEGNDADAKNNHKWGQDYNAFHTIVERLTSRGQTVVDPFMGAGTTLLAAHALGRNVIGCDIDKQHVDTTRRRLHV